MNNTKNKISACLVVYNEEKVVERCLKSIEDLVDEIIVVHDGECSDKTLEIAKKYTDKIFVLDHIGIAEPHRTFTYEKAQYNWILQIDADEFFEEKDIKPVLKLTKDDNVDGYIFNWELWDGKKNYRNRGIKKLALFRRDKITYQGLPQTAVTVDGEVKEVDILLRHQSVKDNMTWNAVNKKRKYWLESHVKYFFPELVDYKCFNDTADSWIAYTKKVRKHPFFYILIYPLKNFLGQMKNGLWKTWFGCNLALQQYIYYVDLYFQIWKMNKKQK